MFDVDVLCLNIISGHGGPWRAIKSEKMLTINDIAIKNIFDEEEKQSEICPSCLYGFWQASRAAS